MCIHMCSKNNFNATSKQRQSVEDYGADVSTAGRWMPRSSFGHETRTALHGVSTRVAAVGAVGRFSIATEEDGGCSRGGDTPTGPSAI